MQHGKGGHCGGWDIYHGVLVAHLCLSYAEDGFFVAVVHLYVPAPDVLLQDILNGQSGIGADQDMQAGCKTCVLLCVGESLWGV